MRTDHRQNVPLIPAFVSWFAAVSAAVCLALVLPVGAGRSAADSLMGSPGPSLTASPAAEPHQALHAVTTTATGTYFRLAESTGCPPASVQPIIALKLTKLPDMSAGVAAVMSRPPLRILLCVWLD